MFKIISKLSPLHFELIYYISYIIFDMIFKKNNITDYIIFGLCIIFSFIYLEILIFNFCDLNKNV